MNTTDTTNIYTLDRRWTPSHGWPEAIWHWEDTNGVFSYALVRVIDTGKYVLVIDRCDAGRRQEFGPYVNHTTATKRVVEHIAGAR